MEDEKLFETSKGVKVVNTFDAMGLKPDLLRGIYAYGVPPHSERDRETERQ